MQEDTKGYTRLISTAEFTDTPRLALEQPTGDVHVEGWDKPEIEVAISDPEGLFEIEENGSQVTVRNRLGKFKLVDFLEPADAVLSDYGVDLSKVAAKVERSVERGMRRVGRHGFGFNMNMDLSNWKGGRDYYIKVPHNCDLNLRTSSGDMWITGVTGTLLLQTSSGDLRLKQLGGNVLINTTSGDTDIDGMEGKLAARTASGDLRTRNLSLQEVGAATVSGDLHLDLVRLPTSSADIRTVSGDLNIYMPSDARFKLEVHTISGSVRCGFPRNQVEYNSTHRRETVLTVNGGGPSFQLKSVSGDVSIRPRKSESASQTTTAPPMPTASTTETTGGANTMDLSRTQQGYNSPSPSNEEANHGDIVQPEGHTARRQAELEILQQVERGEISPQEALAALTALG